MNKILHTLSDLNVPALDMENVVVLDFFQLSMFSMFLILELSSCSVSMIHAMSFEDKYQFGISSFIGVCTFFPHPLSLSF